MRDPTQPAAAPNEIAQRSLAVLPCAQAVNALARPARRRIESQALRRLAWQIKTSLTAALVQVIISVGVA